MSPVVVRSIAGLRESIGGWRREGLVIGMVPTMGAFHAGHIALMLEALRRTDRVVVSLFVNPMQFAAGEDLGSYPHDEVADLGKLSEIGVQLLFAPPREEIYPAGFDTKILVGGPAAGLESDFRPHFFVGVATVVAKLLLAALPDYAFFGEKDYQQLLVVKQLTRDLGIPTEIVGCPTIREPDGLALSSRNAYLTAADRAKAPRLHSTLAEVARRLNAGATPEDALAEGRQKIGAEGFLLDYLEARNAETLARVNSWANEPLRLLAAARLGRTRLIDNIAV